MAELINDNELWLKWKGQMPVIYAKTSIPNPGKQKTQHLKKN
jgi:hypothetical protein